MKKTNREIQEILSKNFNMIEMAAGQAQEGTMTVQDALREINGAYAAINELKSEPTVTVFVMNLPDDNDNSFDSPGVVTFGEGAVDFGKTVFTYPLPTVGGYALLVNERLNESTAEAVADAVEDVIEALDVLPVQVDDSASKYSILKSDSEGRSTVVRCSNDEVVELVYGW